MHGLALRAAALGLARPAVADLAGVNHGTSRSLAKQSIFSLNSSLQLTFFFGLQEGG